MERYDLDWDESMQLEASRSNYQSFFAYLLNYTDEHGHLAVPAWYMAQHILPSLVNIAEDEMVFDVDRVAEHLRPVMEMLIRLHELYDLSMLYKMKTGKVASMVSIIKSPALQSLVLAAMHSSSKGFSLEFNIVALSMEPEWALHTYWLRKSLDLASNYKQSSNESCIVDRKPGLEIGIDYSTGLLTQLLFLPVSTARWLIIKKILTNNIIPEAHLAKIMANMHDKWHRCGYSQHLDKTLTYNMKRSILAQIIRNLDQDRAGWLVAFVDIGKRPSNAYSDKWQFQRTLNRLNALPLSEIRKMRFVSLFPMTYDCSADYSERCFLNAKNDVDRATMIGLMILHQSTITSCLESISTVLNGPMLERVQSLIGMPYVSATFLTDWLRSTW